MKQQHPTQQYLWLENRKPVNLILVARQIDGIQAALQRIKRSQKNPAHILMNEQLKKLAHLSNK